MVGFGSAELNLEVPEVILSTNVNKPVFSMPVNFSSVGVKRLRAVRRHAGVIEDPELNAWIRGLGQKLQAQTAYANRPFYYVIVKDNSVNAYATQGGLIVINSGLILRSATESELASVMAHEIAHVTQQHIERMINESKKNSVGNAAALVAGLLVSANDAEAGHAIVTSAMALGAHQGLTFSRSAETEADREGLRILANAKFDPNGMTDFLQKLHDGVDPRYADIAQYLTTHPLSSQRVSDVGQRAARYGKYQGRQHVSYDYMKEKLRVMTQGGSASGQRSAVIQRYGNALQALRQGKTALVGRLIPANTQQVPEAILLAKSYNQQRQYQKAYQLLQPLVRRYPAEGSLLVPFADALVGLRRTEEAWKYLQQILLTEQTSLEFLEKRQEVARLSGRIGQAYLSIAERNIRIGEYRHALIQLNQALKVPNITIPERQQIQQAIYRAKQFKKK
ncbi:MAG: hypothetical protein CSB47_08885 [Proteobacteria bacterium]|nr:MAG: hypothetical protein CSB47_08885 [Pseudomonadota bacterium]